MAIRKQLSEKRRTYWEDILSNTNNKLKEYLLEYQVREEFTSEIYNVKLIVKYNKDLLKCFLIYVRINDEYCDYEDSGDCIECFGSDKAVRCYIEFLDTEILDGEYKFIYMNSDFSIDDMEDEEEICIFECELELEV